jgi:hypothetical protein
MFQSQIVQFARNLQLCFDFEQRAARMAEELFEFSGRSASRSLRDITGDRDRCTTQLSGEKP